ncbi:PREDICTED: elongation of very long chain fatty acids protein 4-like isoform X2 [Diuraphis noxia]|uniref:elongation of very long chain fatty acids protein 4-like isoform X2 n=1 Tax=Diuraphis noxia TaxID=143948 RepID=UPI0007638907|nr:PREDICTED: elongation of very long chain fatty acids protein 4-like isoform X2 [Diuraphis noxia]
MYTAPNEEFTVFHLDYNLSTLFEQVEHFNQWTESLSDSRTRGWWMVNSVFTTFTIALCYLLIVWLTPLYMKNRTAYNLRNVLIIYNIIMIITNLFIIIEMILMTTKLNYSWMCQPITYVNAEAELRIATAVWLYYIVKFFELLDTIFLILRKKDNQLSFLHVYHHSTMFIFSWLGTKYVPGGSAFLPVLINSTVHVIMYSYYTLAAMQCSKIFKYKKYVTIIQLAQFSFALPLGINAIQSECKWPLWMKYLFVFYIITMLILFGDFYKKNYVKKVQNVVIDKQQ